MCVSFCVRRRGLYWNHVDCAGVGCELASEVFPTCATCGHRQADGRCGLTRAPLPAGEAGCCHCNVAPWPLGEAVEVGREMLAMLGPGAAEDEAAVLSREGVACHRDETGRLWVAPDDLALPYTYGLGTEHLPDEEIDWSGWFEQWQ